MTRYIRAVGVFCLISIILCGCKDKNTVSSDTTAAVVATRSPMETLTIYSINSDAMSLIPVSVKKVSDKNTLKYICSLVVENLDEQDVEVSECTKEGTTAIVSFSADSQPVCECSKKMEKLILDAFANSLLDNVPDCDGVIFRCEGKAYKSENRSFGKNEMYASN